MKSAADRPLQFVDVSAIPIERLLSADLVETPALERARAKIAGQLAGAVRSAAFQNS